MHNPRFNNRKFLGLLLLLVFSILSPLASACELKITWEPWPPFEIETADGQVSGLEGDLLTVIVGEMDRKVEPRLPNLGLGFEDFSDLGALLESASIEYSPSFAAPEATI